MPRPISICSRCFSLCVGFAALVVQLVGVQLVVFGGQARQARADERLWLDFVPTAATPSDRAKGDAHAASGRRAVLLAGDEEYRSEESMPMLARILSQRHGIACRVLFAVDPESGSIDPNNRETLPGYEALDSADVVIMAVRFRRYPEAVMERFDAAMQRGAAVIGLRTSTHAFQFPAENKFAHYNDFGRRVLGENWVSHWGNHTHEATRGVIEPAAANLPILHGVSDIFGDTDVYEAHPTDDAQILVRGEVVSGQSPTDRAANYVKKRSSDGVEQPVNDPRIPIAWTREFPRPTGKRQRVFCTTMGSATDLACEDLRRLVVNAVYWGLELEVPERANVDFVGGFAPSPYAFEGFRKNVKPIDLQ